MKVIKRGSKKGSKNDPKRVKNDHFGVILGSKMVKNSPLEVLKTTPARLMNLKVGFSEVVKKGSKNDPKKGHFLGSKMTLFCHFPYTHRGSF